MRHWVQWSWSIFSDMRRPPSIGHPDPRDRRWRGLAAQHEIAELVQEAPVVLAGDAAGPAAQLHIDRLLDEFLDDAPPHIDVAVVFDGLAGDGGLQVVMGYRLAKRRH